MWGDHVPIVHPATDNGPEPGKSGAATLPLVNEAASHLTSRRLMTAKP